MVITYHGLEFVKISFGDTVLAFNPVSKSSKLKSSSFGADIALVTLNDEDMNGWETLSRGEKNPFVISGPGEYEYKGIFVQGFPSKSSYKGKARLNTFYNAIVEDAQVCFLGAVDSSGIEDLKSLESDIDILFLPIGGDGVLSPEEAYKLAVSLEPRVIVPIHYDKDSLKTFLKESGEENIKPVDKLTLRKKDIAGKEGEIVVLSQS